MSAVDRELVIVPAGAGAGKTHRIKETLSEWVQSARVRPERILAVTFTEAAASELRERIRGGLLEKGMVAEALAAERAYISTIHGLGLRLLTEHALAAGASPQPRHLGDAERNLLIRQALAHSTALDTIKADPERYGYKAEIYRDGTIEDSVRGRVLEMIDLLRSLGDAGRDPALIAPALARLDEIHGSDFVDPVKARDDLLTAVSAMLDAFPKGGAANITARTPREEAEANLKSFHAVVRDPSLLDRDWGLWQKLRKLFVSNRSSRTPEGYDRLAEAIMAAAESIVRHPGPLQDARHNLSCLVACAQEVMAAYEDRKRSFGLIDFADMIIGAERLLRSDPAVLGAVLGEIDCVIIDEFQDTSPVQFALLWQLARRAPRTLLVGDVKQSIMGFQGADPRLTKALSAAYPAASQPLDRNWRSTPAVMQFVNALGAGLFGRDYNSLSPTRPAVDGPALEVLNIVNGRRVRNSSRPQEHVAERISQILTGDDRVTDRHTGELRRVRPSDIALLVCRHNTAREYATALRERTVPVRILEDGWAGGTVVQVARAALCYAANPRDIHSALVFRTMGPDPLPLQEALHRQIEGDLMKDLSLQRLADLSDQVLGTSLPAAVDLVVNVAGLKAWVAGMPDPEQEEADLLRLRAEALAFEEAHRDLKAASGFHGETVKVFLGWLDARAVERDFDRRPDPSGNIAEAVEIVTWHASKGREWPITVVAELDNDIEERPGATSTRFGSLDLLDDMSAVLASAKLVHTPVIAIPETQRRFIEDRRQDFEANARNLLYVALTRARDRIILEWPLFLKERSGDHGQAECLFHVLEDACDPTTNNDSLFINGVACPARIVDPPDLATLTEYRKGRDGRPARFGKTKPLPSTPLSPWRLQPSGMEIAIGSAPSSKDFSIGSRWSAGPSDAERGTSVHLALRTYLTRPDLAQHLPGATGLDHESLSRIEERAAGLRQWLSDSGFDEIRCEIPFVGGVPGGTEIAGTIDLLAIGPKGCLLIDHKTGGIGEGLGPYWPQLSAYLKVVPQLFPETPLTAVAIFWIDHGRLSVANLWDFEGAGTSKF